MCFSTIVFSFCSFCLHISSLTACHLLNLIACAVATKTTTLPDCGLFLCSHFSYCYCAPLLSSLNPLTGDHWFALCLSVCLPHSHCHSAFALFYRISLSFSGCLFVYISGKYFCFPLCAATPEGKRSKKQQAAVVCVCSHFHMNYVLHTYIFEYCMNAFKTANE